MTFPILFILFPIAEFIFFAQISMTIGLGSAFLLMIMSALFGVAIIHQQGIATLLSARSTLQDEKKRTRELFDSLCYIAAGIAFFIPGFLTDILAILLLLPPVRTFLLKKISENGAYTFSEVHFTTHRQYRAQDPNIIDGEFEKIEKDDQT